MRAVAKKVPFFLKLPENADRLRLQPANRAIDDERRGGDQGCGSEPNDYPRRQKKNSVSDRSNPPSGAKRAVG